MSHPAFRSTLSTLAAVFVLLILTTVARAQDVFSARVLADRSPLPAGGKATLAVEVTIAPHWHLQSAKPHDKDLIPTTVTPADAPGILFGPVRRPAGKDIPSPPGLSTQATLSVFDTSATFLVPITIAQDAAQGERTLTLTLRGQPCDDAQCLPPKSIKLTLPVTIAPAGTSATPQHADVFAAAEKQAFLPDEVAATTSAPAATSAAALLPASSVPGVDVPLMSEKDQLAFIDSADYSLSKAPPEPLWYIVLSALLGGMILNIMPCVLPVIPLKVLALVEQAHGDRRVVLAHALVFSAGIVTLFVLLAILLKSFGLFYGQQFQSVAFLTVMAYIVLALALSMLGVWTIQTPQAVFALDKPRTGYAASFSNGILATLLATPCSAPFLGGVLAWGLSQPLYVTIIALGLVGVGMAIPYIILALYPAGLDRLPRAGRWAELVKQGLGLFMVAVALYLITTVPNATYWPWILYGALLVALACWAWGQIPSLDMTTAHVWAIRLTSLALAAMLGLGLYTLAKRYASTPAARPDAMVVRLPHKSDGHTWLPFNLALLQEAHRQNRPVVIDWTADWCINCKFVEATVLSSSPVRDAFAASNAVLLKADLTGTNAPAEALNAKLGGQSIPVLAIFQPRAPSNPTVLRDVYTRDRVITALAK